MDWIDLAQDKNMWRALVDEVMNLRVQQTRGISRLDERVKVRSASRTFLRLDQPLSTQCAT